MGWLSEQELGWGHPPTPTHTRPKGKIMAEKEAKLTQEQEEAMKASAAAVTAKRNEEKAAPAGVGVLRKRGGGPNTTGVLIPSDIEYPAAVHGDDFEQYSPSGMAAVVPDGVEISPYTTDQEFMIDPEKVKTLLFTEAGRNLPKKRLFNVKGIHPDGRLVQLPFELQIQNNAGGDPQDAIGLRRYQRKGILILIDWETLATVYCAAWDCWARAANTGPFVCFCTERHAKHTLPNRYKDAGGMMQSAMGQGIFEQGSTTTQTWAI